MEFILIAGLAYYGTCFVIGRRLMDIIFIIGLAYFLWLAYHPL